MVDRKIPLNNEQVGDQLFEELAFEHLAKKYSISKKDLILLLEKLAKKKNITSEDVPSNSSDVLSSDVSYSNILLPLEILRTNELSSLESIVKFLRENHSLSYKEIGILLHRNPKTLAVTYAASRRKKSEKFFSNTLTVSPLSKSRSSSSATDSIPITIFDDTLSVLESVCFYLKSQTSSDNSYAKIARMIGKDQRTVWTVCHRAKIKLEQRRSKLEKEKVHKTSKNNG